MADMDLLTAEDARELRDIQQRNMPHTCAVYSATEGTLPGGIPTMVRGPALYNGPCRLAPLGEAERERILAGAVDASTRYRVVLPAGTPVQLTNEIDVTGLTHTDAGDVAFGMTLDVEGIEPPNVAIELSRKVIGKARA